MNKKNNTIIKLIVLSWLFLVTFPIMAQDLNLGGGLTKEQEEERDALNRSSSLMRDQARSIWSMDIDPNKYKWNIPIPNYDRPATTSVPQQTIRIDNSAPSGYGSGGSYQVKERERKRKKSEFISSTVARSRANMEMWQENLNRIAEEKRRKREAENAQDRERGRREYYMRTARFHAYNAARDKWMATEGVKQLENIHASELANAPIENRENKLNLMSGNDMADLLKDNKGLTVEIVVVKRDKKRENKNNVDIGNANKAIDLFDGGGYDETSKDLWEYSMTSKEPYITLPEKIKTDKEYEKTLLFKKSQLNLEGMFITTLPGMGCAALLGDSLILLDNNELPLIEWGKNLDVTEVVPCGPRTFAKQGNKIIEIRPEKVIDLATFDTEDFSIFNETDSTIIVCAYVMDMTIVTRFNVERKKYDEVLRITQPLEKICANGNAVFALNGNNIIDIDPSPTLFYRGKESINDLCMCLDGLLVATDKDVTLLKSKDDIIKFSKDGAQRLWCDGEDIYLLDIKGNFYRYSKK